ncbi:MAG TPA: hypothetical protein VJU86_23130 [Pyrinomonadaceae bacterium]|nr:hypothetical protein [Pyrinomonadaceae bacterium]
MKKEQQQNLMYIIFGPFLAIMVGSSLIAAKYPDYINYVFVGLMVVAALLYALMIYMILTKES